MERRALDLARDYAALLAMQRLSWEINFPGTFFSESAFRRSLEAGARYDTILVYEQDGELIAWLWLDLFAAHKNGHIRHIQVQQSHWGQGIARRLLADAVELCQEQGCRTLTLNVTKTNRRAMALYEHTGFVVVEDNGDRQRMVLVLSEASGTPNAAQ